MTDEQSMTSEPEKLLPVIPAGMAAWHGGDGPPADWDGGPVVFRNRTISVQSPGWRWKWKNPPYGYDIVAYSRLSSPVSGTEGRERLALEAIKAVTATAKDAVRGLSRIMAITGSAGVSAHGCELMAKPDVALIVNSPRTEWRHLFERPEGCTIPPEGWTCSRKPGHDGPCAASPSTPIPVIAEAGEREARDVLIDLICAESPALLRDGVRDAVEKDMVALCSKPSRVVRAMLAYGQRLSTPATLDNTAVEGRYYALPFAFHEAPDNGAAYIRDANGQAVAMMMWPWHTMEDEDAAVAETYAIGRAFAAILTAKTEKAE